MNYNIWYRVNPTRRNGINLNEQLMELVNLRILKFCLTSANSLISGWLLTQALSQGL